jgi:hypothetical protein
MKRIIKQLYLPVLLAIFMIACNKDEKKVYFNGGTAPVLTANKADSIPLAYVDKDNEAVKLSWTNPEYQFSTGISSQDVTYLLEIDTAGANFSNPARQSVSIPRELTWSVTQGQLNDYLLNQLVLVPGMKHNVEMRITASINGAVPIYSNVLKFKVTPYAIPPKVTPPPSGKLFITGSATPGNWQCGCGEPELLSQKFTQVTPTLYEITIQLNGGGSYLLIPVYGSWAAKYGGIGPNNTNNVNGDDFKANGGDLLAPPASGLYKIVVDFQRGKFTVTPQ